MEGLTGALSVFLTFARSMDLVRSRVRKWEPGRSSVGPSSAVRSTSGMKIFRQWGSRWVSLERWLPSSCQVCAFVPGLAISRDVLRTLKVSPSIKQSSYYMRKGITTIIMCGSLYLYQNAYCIYEEYLCIQFISNQKSQCKRSVWATATCTGTNLTHLWVELFKDIMKAALLHAIPHFITPFMPLYYLSKPFLCTDPQVVSPLLQQGCTLGKVARGLYPDPPKA